MSSNDKIGSDINSIKGNYNNNINSEMDNIKKIVCLVRDFYDITKGNWSTSDLLLLKTAMSTIDIQPKEPINYYNVLSEINHSQPLWQKLLGNVEIRPIKKERERPYE